MGTKRGMEPSSPNAKHFLFVAQVSPQRFFAPSKFEPSVRIVTNMAAAS